MNFREKLTRLKEDVDWRRAKKYASEIDKELKKKGYSKPSAVPTEWADEIGRKLGNKYNDVDMFDVYDFIVNTYGVVIVGR